MENHYVNRPLTKINSHHYRERPACVRACVSLVILRTESHNKAAQYKKEIPGFLIILPAKRYRLWKTRFTKS